MFDDLLDKIKQKLPERFRGDEVDEEEEIDIEDQTAQHDIDELYDDEDEDLDEDEDEGDEDDEDEDDEEEAAKKKKQLLIRGLLVLVIAYMGLDFYMNQEDEVPEPPKVNRPKRKKKKVVKPKAANNVQENKENQQGSVANQVQEQQNNEPAPAPKPTQENTPGPVAVEEPSKPSQPTVEAAPAPVVEPAPEPVVESPSVQVPSTTNQEVKKDDFAINFDQSENQQEDDISNKLDQITEKLEKETKKELIYVDPPNYEEFGRGLVYNCKNKHWACVGRDPWFQCKDNQAFNSKNGKKSECVTHKTYQSFKDCRTVQIHYINTVAPTPTCE